MGTPDRIVALRRKAVPWALMLGAGLAALAALPVHAADGAAAEEHHRDRQERPERGGRESEAPRQRQEPRQQRPNFVPQQAGQPQRMPPQGGQQGGQGGGQGGPPAMRAPAQQAQAPAYQARNDFRGDFRGGVGGGAAFGPPRGPQGPDARIVAPPRNMGFNRPPPPDRIVQRLPPGYRQYYWGGSPYYHFGSYWYRPYGASFAIVAAPFGLFVPYLPSYYTTFWFGGTRYYYADDTYYLYQPDQHGYVVTQSPYGDDRYADDTAPAVADQQLYVYPTRGQSEQQQADDRYECHRWAVDQAHYDPTDSEYRAEPRAQYDRALAACLTGRGYSVK